MLLSQIDWDKISSSVWTLIFIFILRCSCPKFHSIEWPSIVQCSVVSSSHWEDGLLSKWWLTSTISNESGDLCWKLSCEKILIEKCFKWTDFQDKKIILNLKFTRNLNLRRKFCYICKFYSWSNWNSNELCKILNDMCVLIILINFRKFYDFFVNF